MKKKSEILETINSVHIQQQCSVQSRTILNIQILKYSVIIKSKLRFIDIEALISFPPR